MVDMSGLSPGRPALVVLDSGGRIVFAAGVERYSGELGLKVGNLPPEQLVLPPGRQQEVEIDGIKLCVAAESWQGHTLLMLTDFDDYFRGTATILNSIDEGIHVVNQQGHTVFYNPTMAKMEGMDYSQVINKDVLAMFPSLTPETSTILKVLRSREPIYDQVQTYYNNKGQRITTVNSTIPLWLHDRFAGVLEVSKDVTRMEELARRVVDLQQRLYERQKGKAEHPEMYSFSDIVGNSQALRQPLELARRAARTASPVLIYGETGTGKELVAQSIHNASTRSQEPFIAQNCAALPGSLLEGILFGTVKGSFTGAADRPGLIQQAHGGTLLLDEINSMDIDLQAKLLRVLQDGRVRRVGGMTEEAIDVRIIATTNTQPHAAVSRGTLRQDLYYRLAVVNITLPNLSQRREDIPLLCQHFIVKYNRRFGLDIQGVNPQVMDVFQTYSWPGNVRELEHVIEGAMNILGEEEHYIELRHLPANMIRNSSEQRPVAGLEDCTLPEALSLVQQNMVRHALTRTNGNITRAARLLGITRQALQYKLGKLESDKDGQD